MALAHVNRQQASAATGSKVLLLLSSRQEVTFCAYHTIDSFYTLLVVGAGQIDKERPLVNLPLQVVARMLVLSSSGDSAAQYMNYMNVFFTAQKLNIPVDVCMIGQDSGLLQQGSDITGGLYIKVLRHRT